MTAPDPLARALRRQAQGLYCREAAVELLIAHQTWLRRTEFTRQFVHLDDGLFEGQTMAVIDRAQAIAALQAGRLACSGSEHQILRLAASLADGIPIDLRAALTGLDDTNRDLVATAILHASGPPTTHHQPKEILGG
jgi:hypothetical protein